MREPLDLLTRRHILPKLWRYSDTVSRRLGLRLLVSAAVNLQEGRGSRGQQCCDAVTRRRIYDANEAESLS